MPFLNKACVCSFPFFVSGCILLILIVTGKKNCFPDLKDFAQLAGKALPQSLIQSDKIVTILSGC